MIPPAMIAMMIRLDGCLWVVIYNLCHKASLHCCVQKIIGKYNKRLKFGAEDLPKLMTINLSINPFTDSHQLIVS